MNKFVDFFKSLDKIGLIFGIVMTASAVESATKGQWGWVAISGGVGALNLWCAIPKEKRPL